MNSSTSGRTRRAHPFASRARFVVVLLSLSLAVAGLAQAGLGTGIIPGRPEMGGKRTPGPPGGDRPQTSSGHTPPGG